MKYYYVYRITNIEKSIHYYGTRTSLMLPKEDLGKHYFSSSSDKDFIKQQKLYPENFKYKIVYIFSNRKNALELEIKLHTKFNVGINESFYNRSKQTSTGWDTTGIKFSDKINKSKGRKGTKRSKETIEKIKKTKLKNPFVHSNETKELLRELGKKGKGSKVSEEGKRNMSNARKGKGASSALLLGIFNNDGKLIFECNGNIDEICKENNMPAGQFRSSYRLNRKVYSGRGSLAQAKEEHKKYHNWYTKII